MRTLRLVTAVLVMAWMLLPAEVPAQEAVESSPTTLRAAIDAAIDAVEVFADVEARHPAKPLVVLRWANNQRGSEDGLTMLYIHEGRPIAAACLYPWAGNLVHDFESLSRGQVVARRSGTVVWQPQSSGVSFADVPDAPEPAETEAQRLRQMKAMAGDFGSTMLGWKGDSTDREELRMLPRPLFRYEPKSETAIDGAVFGFVMGTDPETLLLIEAVQIDGERKWQYAFARRTSGELDGKHADRVVWTAARYPETKNPRLTHFSLGTPLPAGIRAELEAGGSAR